jgi:hypothetical protein
MMEDSPARDRLTAGMFIHAHADDPVGRLELALREVGTAEAIEAKVRAAVKAGLAHGYTAADRVGAAVHAGAISAQEAETLQRYEALRRTCIMVDDFPPDVGRHATAEPHAVADMREAVMARKTA